MIGIMEEWNTVKKHHSSIPIFHYKFPSASLRLCARKNIVLKELFSNDIYFAVVRPSGGQILSRIMTYDKITVTFYNTHLNSPQKFTKKRDKLLVWKLHRGRITYNSEELTK
jgi:hypothetical protein